MSAGYFLKVEDQVKVGKRVTEGVQPMYSLTYLLLEGNGTNVMSGSQLPFRGMNKNVITTKVLFCDYSSPVLSRWLGQDEPEFKKLGGEVKY